MANNTAEGQRSVFPALWLTDAQVFKKSLQMKLQMKREAPTKLNRNASESGFAVSSDTDW